MPLQIRTSGAGRRSLSRPGGSGMKGSCGGAKALLSQCPGKVWDLELYKVVVLSFAKSRGEITKKKKNTV